MHVRRLVIAVSFIALVPAVALAGPLAWPLACIPGVDCAPQGFYIGYPDIGRRGIAFNCGKPGYKGHTGTDILVSSVEAGVAVLAAADGEVVWTADGRYDHCPNDAEPDCRAATLPLSLPSPDAPRTLGGPGSCNDSGDCNRFWGFDAGNYILIRHEPPSEVAYTLYAHLRKGSLRVVVGDRVRQGEKIAEAGSSGASNAPHLHFSVWTRHNGEITLADPWFGKCSPPGATSLWAFDPPYEARLSVTKAGSGSGVVEGAGGNISCGSDCSTTVLPGRRITLRAVPYAGSDFAGWQGGGCSGTDPVCTVTAAAIQKIVARFRVTAPPAASPVRTAERVPSP